MLPGDYVPLAVFALKRVVLLDRACIEVRFKDDASGFAHLDYSVLANSP